MFEGFLCSAKCMSTTTRVRAGTGTSAAHMHSAGGSAHRAHRSDLELRLRRLTPETLPQNGRAGALAASGRLAGVVPECGR